MRSLGSGRMVNVPRVKMYQGPSNHMAAWWPFSAGTARPNIGVPLGIDLASGAAVCGDPDAFFRAGLISNPSIMIYGDPGLGKSTLTARLMLGVVDRGFWPLIPADLKGEYVDLARALGVPVVAYKGTQTINPLEQWASIQALHRLGSEKGADLYASTVDRAAELVVSLIRLIRREKLIDWEKALISRATRHMFDARHIFDAGTPGAAGTLVDMLNLIWQGTDDLHALVAEKDDDSYQNTIKPLVRSFRALMDGPTGRIFSGTNSTVRFGEMGGLCVDLSGLMARSDEHLASVMLSMWTEGFASIEAANNLADHKMEPQRHHNIIMDEMWKALRIEGAGLVDRLDAATRLNRSDGSMVSYIAHTPKDQQSMNNAADARKALGFTERVGMVITHGLSRDDLELLSGVISMSEAEIDQVSSWGATKAWDANEAANGSNRPAPPPGVGKGLMKIGDRPGVGFKLLPTERELNLHDTNSRWVKED